MTTFWLAAAALIAAGIGFFVPVLLGHIRTEGAERRSLNLLIHRQRRQELGADAPDGAADPQLAEELDRDLLTDLDTSAPAALKASSAGRASLMAGLVVAAALGIGLYLHLGQPNLVAVTPAEARKAPSGEDIAAGIQQLAEHLAKNPNDLEGWRLLARTLLATGQPDRAATAFDFAIKLAPDDLDLKASLAQALAETQKGSLQGRPAELAEEIVKRDPAHPTGLWLAGLAAAERRDVGRAVNYWQKLRSLLPPNSEDQQQIDQYITKVQGLKGTPAESPKPSASGESGASIRVKVTLAESLKSRTAPNDFVFIFARAASGPPMPLAVVRRQVRDLPVEVTLSDAMAMMPERKLSSFDQIVIGARVSKSGQPIPSSGDLQGLSKPVSSKSTPTQTVEILEIVP
jgi:cytochrome c-type biogenesis protein CcmH